MKFILAILASFIFCTSCLTQKNSRNKHSSIIGLFATEKLPADIGRPYRLYLNFNVDGTVLALSSSMECDSVKYIIESKFNDKATYTFIKKANEVKFVINGVSVTKNMYEAKYSGILNGKQLSIEKKFKYKTDINYSVFKEMYIKCE